MAWVFGLSVDCGPNKDTAELFSAHFDAVSWTLSNNTQSQCHTTIFQDIDDNWWCRVCPDGLSEIGIESPDSAYLMTERGIFLYQHLKSSPTYRFALVGVEVDEFRTHNELLDDATDLDCPGLVLSETLWRSIDQPSTFRPFSPGYVWRPYEGEVYQPLVVSSKLQEQMNTLLAA
ncbi:hypothetical protein U2F10_06420 [Leptothoe sp. EHU-05/26/07-4]